MRRKKLFISLTAIAAVFVLLGIFLLIWFVGDTYPDFKKFKKEFAIEGLDDGAIPQGLAEYNLEEEVADESGKTTKIRRNYFLTSAYMKDGSASRIYVTEGDLGYVGYVTMLNEDGTPHTGHVGGIATNASRLWVTYGKKILVAQASEDYKSKSILHEIVDKAKKNFAPEENDTQIVDSGVLSIQFTASFNANCNAAYLYYFHDPRYVSLSYDRLYVGEFYRKGNYETAESHRLKTPNGYDNTSFMYEYRVNTNTSNKYGLDLIDSDNSKNISDNVPKIQKIYSLPEMIQGIAFSGREGYGTTSGMLILSQSYGLPNSHLLCFDWSKVNANSTKYTSLDDGNRHSFEYDGVYFLNGNVTTDTKYFDKDLLVYYVDKSDSEMFVNDYSVPSMSEGMCTLSLYGQYTATQERVYVLFESGSKKYNLFTRESMKNVYSFIPQHK